MSTTSNTTTKPNMTSEEIEEYLDHLQDRDLPQYIPALVYLILLAVTGLVGNSLVLLVYRSKYPRSTTRIFIMSIAILDLVTNVVCTPGHVFEIFHMWDFAWPGLCRFDRYVNAVTAIPSACILVAVAFSRYLKICKPFKNQVTPKYAKIVTVSIGIFSWIVSIPFLILNGTHTRPTPLPGIDGHQCFIDDDYIDTIWPLANYVFMLFLLFASILLMVILYTLIGIKAYKQRKNHSPGKNKIISQQPTKNSISDYTEGKPWKRFFVFWNRKNKSIDKHLKAEDVLENGKRSMSEESSMTRRLSQEHDTVDFSMSSDLKLELDSIKLEGEVFDSEERTNGAFAIDDKDNDWDHKTIDGVAKKSYDEDNAGEMDGKGQGTCPDPERINPEDTTLSTDNEDLEKNNRKSLMDTLTKRRTPKDNEENEKEMHVCETVVHSSDEKEIIQTLYRNDLIGSSQAPALETKDITNETSDQRVKPQNDTIESPQTSPTKVKNVSKETAEAFKRTQTVLNVHKKNGKQNVLNRTTCMLFLITAVFILGFIPHVVLVFFRYTKPTTYKAMGTHSLSAYHLFFRSYLLNSAANPIIYNFCDAKFRHNVLCFFRRLLKRCRTFQCCQWICPTKDKS